MGFSWQAEDWILHRKPLSDSPDFQREIKIVSSTVIVERFVHVERPLAAERRFVKFGDDWQLIYYAGLNTFRRVSPVSDQ